MNEKSFQGKTNLQSGGKAGTVGLIEPRLEQLPAKAQATLDRLALVAQKAANAIVIFDSAGYIEWVNPGFTTLTGYELEEVRGRRTNEFLHGEKTDPVASLVIRQALENCQPIEGEIYNYHKNGQGFWVFISVTPIYDENGAHQGFIAIGSDVTEQKELLASLQQSREHYRALTETAPDIILTISPNHEILFINAAAQRLLGYAPVELMGQPLSFLISEEPGNAYLPALLRALAAKEVDLRGEATEFAVRRADGQTLPMELSCSAFQLRGETYFSGVLRDITERRHVMELLKQREQQAGLKAEISATLAAPQGCLAATLENTALVLKGLLDLALVRIWTFNPEIEMLELQANIGIPQAPMADYQQIPLGAHRIGQIAQTRCPFLTNDVANDVVNKREWAHGENVTAFAGYPLLVEGRLVGALALFSRHPLSTAIFESLATVAELIAQRLERQRLDDALAEAHAKLEMRVKTRTAELLRTNEALQAEINERKRVEEELHEAQEFLRLVLNDLPNPVFVKDEAGRFTMVNSAFASLYGRQADEMLGKTDFDFSTPEEAEHFRADDLQVLESQQDKLALEEKHTDYQGNVHWLQTAKRPLRLGPNRPQYLLGISTDLTERKALEGQLRQAQKLESIGQLAAGIAHEINTPTQYVGDNTRFVQDAFKDLKTTLQSLRSLLQATLNEREVPETVAQMAQELAQAEVEYLLEEIPAALQQSLEGVQRIAQIVQSMKDFSHPGSGEKKATDLNKAIASTVTVARNEWKYVADVEMHFDDQLPLVPCLLGEFNQVILNMVVNAAHAIAEVVGDGGKGKGKITITTQQVGQQWAEVRISDTGNGIPPAIHSRIFDPFFTTKAVGIGTGQGLAISHHVIVEKHQGQLTFDTVPGGGTTFIIRLPLAPITNSQERPKYESKNSLCR
ncbi:MAG: PAS domain S-box protein [Blastocatellia bacterium]